MWLAVVAAHAALVVAVVLAVRAGRRSRASAEAMETIPYEDWHPVASYLYAMCGVEGQRVGDFAYAGSIWLLEGRLRLPAGSRRLRRRDRAGLPPPYADRPPVTTPVA